MMMLARMKKYAEFDFFFKLIFLATIITFKYDFALVLLHEYSYICESLKSCLKHYRSLMHLATLSN